MKRFPEIAGILALLVMVYALAGCQSWSKDATARDKYADAERTFGVVLDTAYAAYQAGELKGERLVLVKAALSEADAALKEMNARVKTGDPIEADYWLGRVDSALRAAQAYLGGAVQ